MLANSFFYLFLVVSILGLLIFASNFKYNINFFKRISIFMLCLSIITIGLVIAIIQNFFSESDYSNRIGLYNVNIENKLYLINHFSLNYFN